MARPRKPDGELDLDLEDLPAPARWREWMGRVEAVIFASAQPVLRESLARVVGRGCNLDLIIDDIRDELSGRPYELVSVAGGWSFRTKLGFGDAIRAAIGGPQKTELSRSNALVLMAIAYFQPITRGELSQFLGREVSRDAIAALRGEGFIAAGPRSPTPGAPYAYVTTPGFLAQFGFESLRDLPDIEKLEDAGLLGRTSEALLDGDALASELRGVLGLRATRTSPRKMRRRRHSWRNLAAARRWPEGPRALGRGAGPPCPRARRAIDLSAAALLVLVLSRPTISPGNIAQELRITPRALRDHVGDLGLRGVTGRGRYRALGNLVRGFRRCSGHRIRQGSGAGHRLRNGRPWRPDGLSFSVTCRVGVILRAVKSAPKVLTDLAVLNCHFRI